MLGRIETEKCEHLVQFYDDEHFFAESVGGFIGAGLGAGENAIVIAQPAHRRLLEARLQAQGLDFAAASRRGQLLCLDARETLQGFMAEGMPDETLFLERVGSLIKSASENSRGLRLFGEMVALLWADGNRAAALRLERLWTGLGRKHAFSLLCAYPSEGFGSGEREQVCAEHSRVLAPQNPPGGSGARMRSASENARLHLAAIVESSDDAIISKDLDGTITSWNRSAERLFGYSAAEIIGKSVTLLIPPEHLDEEPTILRRVRGGERVDHYETVRRRKDGSMVEISLTVSPIRDDDGVIIGASKIVRDISDRRQQEAALAEATEQLRRTNAELESRVEERTATLREALSQLEEFSYTVSHDLRAPLRGMQIYSRALLEDFGASLDPEARHYLDRICENAFRLDRMVRDVLSFSRVAREDLSLEKIALGGIVEDIVAGHPGMQPPRALIEVDALPEVTGHAPSLTQALSNLLANAVKFVRAGVTPKVRIRAERAGADARIWIEDNGIGIEPRHQPRLFTMFERIHPDLKYEGSGVGLAIVRKAVERMGGSVGVESDGTNGSRFWLQVPAAEGRE